MEFNSENPLFEWRGPAPFYFVRIDEEESALIKSAAKELSYGWGVIPVTATVGKTTWTTSLFPKDGVYLLPVKAVVQNAEQLEVDDQVSVSMRLGKE